MIQRLGIACPHDVTLRFSYTAHKRRLLFCCCHGYVEIALTCVCPLATISMLAHSVCSRMVVISPSRRGATGLYAHIDLKSDTVSVPNLWADLLCLCVMCSAFCRVPRHFRSTWAPLRLCHSIPTAKNMSYYRAICFCMVGDQ